MARSILGRPIYHTGAYWVDGMMVDTGCAHTARELVSALEGLDLDLVVNTHSHEDHIGANHLLAQERGATVFAHVSALPALALKKSQVRLRPYQAVMWGYPEPSNAEAVDEEVETAHHRFKVIHTPGHSPDHICLHEPAKGWLFCGDTYVGGRDRALRADYDIWQIIASLKKLSDLDVGLLFTGSGNVRENGRPLLLDKIDYLESAGEEALALHRQGLDYDQIRDRLFGREMLIAYVTLGHFSGRNLVRSFVEDYPRHE